MTTTVTKCEACNSDIIDRGAFVEPVCENGDEMNKKIYAIQKAIKKHHYRLDQRKHGGVSENQAFSEICGILGLSWEQGVVTEFLDKHPKLKPFYEST